MILFCDKHNESYQGYPEHCAVCKQEAKESQPTIDLVLGTTERKPMTVPGFYDIDLVLSGVTLLKDNLDRLRTHSLEMAVNSFSRRSVECDLQEIQKSAEQIRDAAARLTKMCHAVNTTLPIAEPSHASSPGVI